MNKNSIFPVVNVVLHEPEIPPNTGNIGRTVLGVYGRLHLVGELGFRIDEQALKRAGLDYWQLLDVRFWATLEELDLQDKRFFLFTKAAFRPFFEADFKLGDYLVFGSESRGLPRQLLDANPEKTLQIPTIGDIRSYNLACAVHSACLELIRQNHNYLNKFYRQLEREIP